MHTGVGRCMCGCGARAGEPEGTEWRRGFRRMERIQDVGNHANWNEGVVRWRLGWRRRVRKGAAKRVVGHVRGSASTVGSQRQKHGRRSRLGVGGERRGVGSVKNEAENTRT